MKYLSEYVEKRQTALFKELGIFFACDQKQFEEQEVKGVEYVGLPMQMVCPKKNVKGYLLRHPKLIAEGMAEDLKDNGMKGIIHRELGNHEAYYTYSIEDTVGHLAGYGFTREQVQAEFGNYCRAHEEWEASQ